MTTPLDRDLAERLERLAAAVPVRAGQLDPVHAGAVRARQQVRMRWLTPLVALVVVGLIAGIVGVGPLNVLNGPIEVTARQGDFVLTFRSAKARYTSGEPIELSASLTYEGPGSVVRISHAHGTPFGFGLREPVNGIMLSPGWRMSCELTDLVQGVPLEHAFRKSGGDTADTPGFERFMQDPTLHLTAGTWHAYAVAHFGTDGCGGRSVELRADLTIDVFDPPTPTAPPTLPIPESAAIHIVNLDPGTVEVEFRNRSVAWLSCGESVVLSSVQLESSAPWHFIFRDERGSTIDAATVDWHLPAGILIRDGVALTGPWPMSYGPATGACDPDGAPSPSVAPPSPTAGTFPSPSAEVVALDSAGPYALELRSAKAVYGESDVIDVFGAFTYSGTEPIDLAGFKGLIFSVREPVDGVKLGGFVTMECNIQTLRQGERLVSPFRKNGGVSSSDPEYERKLAYLQDPVFRLPVGVWHISVSGSFNEDACGGDRRVSLSATIEIEVVPD